jgi:hypothetical protein
MGQLPTLSHTDIEGRGGDWHLFDEASKKTRLGKGCFALGNQQEE